MTQEPTPHDEAAEVQLSEAKEVQQPTAEEIKEMIDAAKAGEEEVALAALNSEPHRQAINSGSIKNMQFQQALLLALGQKTIYFSASNPNIDAPEGTNTVTQSGAVYLRPDGDRHFVKGEVLQHYVQGNLLENVHEEDALGDLPIYYNLQTSKKPIAEITEAEAKAAGYARRPLQIRLALQTEYSFEFGQALMQKAANVAHGMVGKRVSQQEFEGFLEQILPKVIEGLRFGIIKGDETMGKQAAAVVNELLRSNIIQDSDIPGTTDIFNMKVATPQQLVEDGHAPDEATAKKQIGTVLSKIYEPISHSFGLTAIPIRNEMSDLFGTRKFNAMLTELSKQIDGLLGKSEEKPKLSLETQIMISGREIGDWKRGELLNKLKDAGDDAAKRAAVQTEFAAATAAATEAVSKSSASR